MKTPSALVIGRNAVDELLSVEPGRFLELWVAQSTDRNARGDALIDKARKARIAVQSVRREKLTELVGGENHQGIVGVLKPKPRLELKSFIQSQDQVDRSVVVMLDSIFDPHNVGAILRACECFGISGVVYSKNRGAPITPIVSKVSAGASELVPLIEVSNLAQSLEKLKEAGFQIVAADSNEGSKDIQEIAFAPKVVFIFGSEGEGVQPLLLKKSDFRLKIPMFGRIDSLNVSQAAAVVLYAAKTIKVRD